jgi:hypothetical protein
MRPWLIGAGVTVLVLTALGIRWAGLTQREADEARLELQKLELQKLDAEKQLDAEKRASELHERTPFPRDLEDFDIGRRRMGDFPPWYGKGPQPALLPPPSKSTNPGAWQFKFDK